MKSSSPGSSSGTSGSSAAPAGSAPGVLGLLGSIRLGVGLMTVLILFCALASVIAQQDTAYQPLEKLYAPELLHFMKLVGLTDIFHSSWFISVLGLLGLNLIFAVLTNAGPAWRVATQKVPTTLNLQQALSSRNQEKYVHLDFSSTIGREQFRELVKSWCRGRIGKVHALRDEGGLNELQLAGHHGRFTKVSLYLSHFSLVIIGLGALIGALSGFEGRLDIDEGARVGYIQITKGGSQNWPILQEMGKVMPGFFEPDFQVECRRFELELYPLSEKVKYMTSWLDFYRRGKLVSSKKISVNEPAVFQGMRFYQAGYAKSSQLRASITVRDRLSGEPGQDPTSFQHLLKNKSQSLEGAEFRVLEIEEAVGARGPAAQIEFTPRSEGSTEGEPQTFWIFQKFPQYDEVNRKTSRFIFALDEVQPSYNSSIFISRDPGAPWVWAGCILLIVTLFSALYFSHNRYWFIWRPGRVVVIGWSSKLFLFEPRFERAMEKFRARVVRLERPAK